MVRRRHLLPQHRARELHRLLRTVGRAGLRHVARPGAGDRAGTGTAAPARRELGCRHDLHDRRPDRDRGAPGARGVGDHPALDPAGDRDTVGLVGGPAARGRVDPRRPARGGRPGRGAHRRPAGRDPVPAGGRARLRGARRRHPAGRGRHRDRAGVLGRRGRSTRSTTPASSSPTGAGSSPTTRRTASSSRRSSRDEIGQGEGANLVIGRHYRAEVADWGVDKALTVFRRLLERERGAYWTYVFFTGDRYLIGASPERTSSDATAADVRMNPISGTFRLPRDPQVDVKAGLLDFLARREGDLRALHGRRRGAQDDVRHLPRGRPGARAVPQADDAPRAHRVPARRPHPPRPARGAARHDVRRDRHRQPGGERLPADQAVRAGGARLLRRRARRARPGPRTAGRSWTARS